MNININIGRVDLFLGDLREALEGVRRYGGSLASDLNIIQTRETFVRRTINTLESGADDLVVADQNRLGANMLALQTRQVLQSTALSLAADTSRSVLLLF